MGNKNQTEKIIGVGDYKIVWSRLKDLWNLDQCPKLSLTEWNLQITNFKKVQDW